MALSKWWKTGGGQDATPGRAVPEGRRVYAIGDVHGRADLLDAMARLVERDLADRPGPDATTIFLGDYVDRGPDSAGVVDRLVRRDWPTPLVALRGNHEDLFVGFLTGQIDPGYHTQLGGDATLRSYGIDPGELAALPPEGRAALLQRVPDRHCSFLDMLQLSETVGDYFFVHAGVRPGVPLDRQSPDDMLWIRDDFLRSKADFGKTVVHGHTPVREPQVRVNGINIDTQAYASGVLTALVLEGREIRFLRT